MRRHAYLWVIVVCGLLWPSFALGWSAKVVKIISPHEFMVRQQNGSQEQIRLYGIDAPQPPQVFGSEAQQYVSARALGKIVEVQPLVRDQFDRLIAYVYIDGQSLTEDLLRGGVRLVVTRSTFHGNLGWPSSRKRQERPSWDYGLIQRPSPRGSSATLNP